MSYSATISFKHIEANNIKGIFDFLTLYKKTIIDNLSSIAKDAWYYCPALKDKDIDCNNIKDVVDHEPSRSWFERLFRYRWFYDDSLGLLGIYGVPKVTESLFDGTCYFQNSCDQDYERNEWSGIKEFENIFDKWQLKTNEDIIDYLKTKRGYTDKDIVDIEHFDYYRRWGAYNEIWGRIENTLYDEDSITYISIFAFYDISYKIAFLKECAELFKKATEEG